MHESETTEGLRRPRGSVRENRHLRFSSWVTASRRAGGYFACHRWFDAHMASGHRSVGRFVSV